MKRFWLATLGALACTAASAAPLTYSYLRTFDLAPHDTSFRANSMCVDVNGGVYYTDNVVDYVFYINDILNDIGTADNPTTVSDPNLGGPSFSGGFSFEGITHDGTAVLAGGKDGTGVSQFGRFVPNNPTNPTAWTVQTWFQLGEYTGPDAIAPNRFAVADGATGALSFVTYDGSNLVPETGSPYAGGTATSHMVQADLANGRVFVSTNETNLTGRVNVFTANGTGTSASYVPANNPVYAGVATTVTQTNHGQRYQNIALNKADQILAVSVNTGAQPGNGWALIDVATPGANKVPFQFINLSDAPRPDASGFYGPISGLPNPDMAHACAFGTKGGVKFMVVCSNNKLHVYKQNASSVGDWHLH